MADFTSSINMGLPIPTVGVAPGPEWATLLDSCLTIIDSHSHVSGSGVQITPAAININSDLTMGSNNLTTARTVRFDSQPSALALAADLGCLYEVADDLYYNDGAGNQIRLTQSGSIVGSAGSITGLPSGTASASYISISSKFVWQSATNTAADMDMGAAIMRNISPNSTYALTLQPPAALGSNYAITLPSLPSSTRIVSLSASGALATGVASTIVTADIGALQVTDATIANSTITGGKIAPTTITGSNIAPVTIAAGNIITSTLTGTQMSASINFPGNAVQENGKNVVVSNTNAAASLAIIRAGFNGAGTLTVGEGVTVTSHPSTGNYVLTYTTAFADTTVPVITPLNGGGFVIPTLTAVSSTGCSFSLIAYSTALQVDSDFLIIVAGLRA